MSYILDALRKSDLQRRRGATPTLLEVQESPTARKRPAIVAYGVLAAVLVGAGIVIGWLRPWQPEQAPSRKPEPVAARAVESTPRQPGPAPAEMATQPKPQEAPAQTEMAPQPKPQPKLQNTTRSARSELAPKPKPAARAKPQTEGPARQSDAAASGATAAAAPERPVDDAAADDADEQAVMAMAELPDSVRKELPPMRISVHAYSDNPAARLVGIDNRILREGDSVVPGLRLEQITPDGMIFSYREYRFRRGVK
jgi:general secretion pathway protein B